MGVTNYIWDPVSDNVIMETDENDDVIATYEHEPTLHGELNSMTRDGQTYYYDYDGEGNTVAVTDENQNVVERASYTAFGEVVEKTSSIVNPFGYKGALGYYTDAETGNVDVRRRTYEPQTGRWLTADGSSRLNRYSRATNGAAGQTDSTGASGIGRLPLRLSSGHCKGCGEYEVEWLVSLPNNEERLYVIQKICISNYVRICKENNGCCEDAERFVGECCFYEQLGGGLTSQNPTTSDKWGLPGYPYDPNPEPFAELFPAKCTSRGFSTVHATIRAFRKPQDVLPPNQGATDSHDWQDPTENFRCGQFGLGIGYHIRAPGPAWIERMWNEQANPAWSYESTNSIVYGWNCCPYRPPWGEGAIGSSILGYDVNGENSGRIIPCENVFRQ